MIGCRPSPDACRDDRHGWRRRRAGAAAMGNGNLLGTRSTILDTNSVPELKLVAARVVGGWVADY